MIAGTWSRRTAPVAGTWSSHGTARVSKRTLASAKVVSGAHLRSRNRERGAHVVVARNRARQQADIGLN
jgi:hypothetical protein